MKIKNKVFAITGVSSGMGKATAEMILHHGGSVMGIDLTPMEEGFVEYDPKQWLLMEGDVQSAEQVRQCLEEGARYFGAVHGAIACAGIAPARTLYSSRKGGHPWNLFLQVLKVNLGGTFNLFNEVVPLLIRNEAAEKENGVLIATSSIASSEGQVGQVAYSASKGGVSAMILPMARELARYKIRVNAISPGIFHTPMVSQFSDEVRDDLAGQVPFPARLGQPEEFAALVATILENEYINGAIYRLDGGVRMR